jgi:hypothetical protein
MRARPRDALWGVVAILVTSWLVWKTIDFVAIELQNATWFDVVHLLLAVSAFFATVGRWLIMGAWRRTKWGAPSGGERYWVEQRHGYYSEE